jgi:hypothetical protein
LSVRFRPITPAAAGPVLPLTVDQLNALMATDLNGLIGRRLVITGTLQLMLTDCFNPNACPSLALLVGSSPQLEIKAIPADLRLTRDATFSAVLDDPRTLTFEASVTTASGGVPLMPSELIPAGSAAQPADLRLVQGWLTGLIDPLPCPLLPATPAPGPQFGCGRTAYLTDDKLGPINISGVFTSGSSPRTTSAGAIQVQNDGYQTFAPAPTSTTDSTRGRFSVPERATFLVQAVYTNPCLTGMRCPVLSKISGWQIIARLDPWPQPPASPSPAPSTGSAMAVSFMRGRSEKVRRVVQWPTTTLPTIQLTQ